MRPARNEASPTVVVAGRSHPLSHARAERAARLVLEREHRTADLSITFVGRDRMRALNAEWKGADRPTDVLAFRLTGPDRRLTGDIYVCPGVAARGAKAHGASVREELIRLVVHGTLHVLGYDHADGERRTLGPMWLRQERYVACLG
ncbi:MAG: rRNA maturation RNase YbeY [Gemmatimonadota bacterium]